MSSAPKSTRLPGVRAGLMGLLPLLLPLVWVLELDSCGRAAPLEQELTGSRVLGAVELEGWMVVAPVLLLSVLAPFLANRLRPPGARVVVHLFGLAAAVLIAWGTAFVMFFTLFRSREARGAGWLVLALLVAAALDGLWRLGWSLVEWRRARLNPASRAAPS